MIRYIGLKNLRPLQIKEVEEISERNFDRIRRDFKDATLVVYIKKQDRLGKPMFSVNLRLDDASIRNILLAKETDWDLPRVMHKVFDNLSNEINHKFKTNVTRKSYKK